MDLYKVKIYHTWRGAFLPESESMVTDGNKISFSIPTLKAQGSHGNYFGEDTAFILEPMR